MMDQRCLWGYGSHYTVKKRLSAMCQDRYGPFFSAKIWTWSFISEGLDLKVCNTDYSLMPVLRGTGHRVRRFWYDGHKMFRDIVWLRKDATSMFCIKTRFCSLSDYLQLDLESRTT